MTLSESRIREAGDHLRDEGYVVVKDYWDQETCREVALRIESRVNDGMPEAEPGTPYGELAARDEAVRVERGGAGYDAGMTDVFNIDQEIEDLATFRRDPEVAAIVNRAADETFSADNLNTYITRGVTNPRDLHADTYAGKYKSFLYLTDVREEGDGPYSYVSGSHRWSRLLHWPARIINSLRGRPATDAIYWPDDKVVRFTAPRGTLIISNQAGYHGATPQDPDGKRILVTTSYTPGPPAEAANQRDG